MADREDPGCTLDVFEIDMLKNSAGPLRLMKTMPPELIDCKPGFYEIRKKLDPITPYCVKLDTIGKLHLRGWPEPDGPYPTGSLVVSLVRHKILSDDFFIDVGGIPDTLNVYIVTVLESRPPQYVLVGEFDAKDDRYAIKTAMSRNHIDAIRFTVDDGGGSLVK